MCEKTIKLLWTTFSSIIIPFFPPLWDSFNLMVFGGVNLFLSRPHSPLGSSSRHDSDTQPMLKPAAFICPYLSLIFASVDPLFLTFVFTSSSAAPLLCPSSTCPAFPTFLLQTLKIPLLRCKYSWKYQDEVCNSSNAASYFPFISHPCRIIGLRLLIASFIKAAAVWAQMYPSRLTVVADRDDPSAWPLRQAAASPSVMETCHGL